MLGKPPGLKITKRAYVLEQVDELRILDFARGVMRNGIRESIEREDEALSAAEHLLARRVL